MIQDKFSKMVHCDVRISKVPPVQFIDDFLTTCAPAKAAQKFVMSDQRGELNGSPQMLKIFKKHNCTMPLIALDASNQNPVERHHHTVSNNVIQAVPIGANPPIKFGHAVCHMQSEFSSHSHLKVKLPARLKLQPNMRKTGHHSKHLDAECW